MQQNSDTPPPLTDEELRDITIGELPEHNATIHLAEYDPEWPRLYRREAKRIGGALGPKALRIQHVGSTSVLGLAELRKLIDRQEETTAQFRAKLEQLETAT